MRLCYNFVPQNSSKVKGGDILNEMELMQTIGDNLRDLLAETGYSQNELAKYTNISQSTISRYANGEVMPGIKNIINICYCLECDLNDLIPEDYFIT